MEKGKTPAHNLVDRTVSSGDNMIYPRTSADVNASRDLLDWLQSAAAQRGMIEDITWDHPDMFRVEVRLAPSHAAVVFAWTEQTHSGLVVGAGMVRFDPLDSSESGNLDERRIRRRHVVNRLAAITLMQDYLGRLFTELDRAVGGKEKPRSAKQS